MALTPAIIRGWTWPGRLPSLGRFTSGWVAGVGEMAHFELHGIRQRVPDKTMDAELRKSLENGDYEWNERLAVTRHVTGADVVLDIGAGIGFISALAAQVTGPA